MAVKPFLHKVGDVILATSYDQEDEVWQQGPVLITEVTLPAIGTPFGGYRTHPILSGINYTWINRKSFEEESSNQYLGNINDTPALIILFGPEIEKGRQP